MGSKIDTFKLFSGDLDMRNPNETAAQRESRHNQEYAYSMRLAEENHKEELTKLRQQIEKLKNENPDPCNWELIDEYTQGKFIALKLRYPNCTNHKGLKILVYQASLVQLIKQKVLDPHFGSVESTKLESQPKDMLYPIARLPANDQGWEDAKHFVNYKFKQAGGNTR